MNLFDSDEQNSKKPSLETKALKDEPLASRMRPRELSEFVGQGHLLGEDGFLRRALEKEAMFQPGLGNMVLAGPPGSGKTTLALLLARETQREFLRLSAVLDGLKELRSCLAHAEQHKQQKAPILFIDEIHRWNKAQQDALLPWVEQGTVLLVGATTENPAFQLNNALLSRVRILELAELQDHELQQIMQSALLDEQRGLGSKISLQTEAQNYLIEHCSGDARRLLNALELLAQIYEPETAVNVEMARQCLQRQNLYDRSGDYHYDSISAFIKSVRGSSVDDALYWLQVMLQGGENPSFIFRRLLILAAEDIGLADPQALVQVHSAAQAFERVGLPEGEYFLSQATIYLSLAPKSNSVGAFWAAKVAVKERGPLPVPLHLRGHAKSASKRLAEKKTISAQTSEAAEANYLYPHNYRGNWIEQSYSDLHTQNDQSDPNNPNEKRATFYQAGKQGWERERGRELQSRREILAEAQRLEQNLKQGNAHNSNDVEKTQSTKYWENRHELLLAWDEARNKLARALHRELGAGCELRFIGKKQNLLAPLNELLQHIEATLSQTSPIFQSHSTSPQAYPSELFLQQAWQAQQAQEIPKTEKTSEARENWEAREALKTRQAFAEPAKNTNIALVINHLPHWPSLFAQFGSQTTPDLEASEFWQKFRQYIGAIAKQQDSQVLFFGEKPSAQEPLRVLQQLDTAHILGDLQQKLQRHSASEAAVQDFFSSCQLKPIQNWSVSYEQILHPRLWHKIGKLLPEDLREEWQQAYSILMEPHLAKSDAMRITLIKCYVLLTI